jgi:hypothetical protein
MQAYALVRRLLQQPHRAIELSPMGRDSGSRQLAIAEVQGWMIEGQQRIDTRGGKRISHMNAPDGRVALPVGDGMR